MNVIASFRLNKQLEHAIAELEMLGIERESILALPLETQFERGLYQEKQKILFESAPIIGMILMLLGTIYGYVLEWGPIIWALIGLIIGMGLGFIVDIYRVKRKGKQESIQEGKPTEVFLLINCCDKNQALLIKEKLWEFAPMGVTTFCANQMENR